MLTPRTIVARRFFGSKFDQRAGTTNTIKAVVADPFAGTAVSLGSSTSPSSPTSTAEILKKHIFSPRNLGVEKVKTEHGAFLQEEPEFKFHRAEYRLTGLTPTEEQQLLDCFSSSAAAATDNNKTAAAEKFNFLSFFGHYTASPQEAEDKAIFRAALAAMVLRDSPPLLLKSQASATTATKSATSSPAERLLLMQLFTGCKLPTSLDVLARGFNQLPADPLIFYAWRDIFSATVQECEIAAAAAVAATGGASAKKKNSNDKGDKNKKQQSVVLDDPAEAFTPLRSLSVSLTMAQQEQQQPQHNNNSNSWVCTVQQQRQKQRSSSSSALTASSVCALHATIAAVDKLHSSLYAAAPERTSYRKQCTVVSAAAARQPVAVPIAMGYAVQRYFGHSVETWTHALPVRIPGVFAAAAAAGVPRKGAAAAAAQPRENFAAAAFLEQGGRRIRVVSVGSAAKRRDAATSCMVTLMSGDSSNISNSGPFSETLKAVVKTAPYFGETKPLESSVRLRGEAVVTKLMCGTAVGFEPSSAEDQASIVEALLTDEERASMERERKQKQQQQQQQRTQQLQERTISHSNSAPKKQEQSQQQDLKQGLAAMEVELAKEVSAMMSGKATAETATPTSTVDGSDKSKKQQSSNISVVVASVNSSSNVDPLPLPPLAVIGGREYIDNTPPSDSLLSFMRRSVQGRLAEELQQQNNKSGGAAANNDDDVPVSIEESMVWKKRSSGNNNSSNNSIVECTLKLNGKQVIATGSSATEIGAVFDAYNAAYSIASSATERKTLSDLVNDGAARGPQCRFANAEDTVAALVHFKFGMPLTLQRTSSARSELDLAAAEANSQTTITAVAVSALTGVRYFLGSGSSLESPARAMQICLQNVLNAHFSEWALAVLDGSEKVVAFPGSTPPDRTTASDAYFTVRRYLQQRFPHGWALTVRTLRQWHGEVDSVVAFVARIVAVAGPQSDIAPGAVEIEGEVTPRTSGTSTARVIEVCRHESSDSLFEAIGGCLSAAYEPAGNAARKQLLQSLERVQLKLNPKTVAQNLLTAAQQLLAKAYGLQLVISFEHLTVTEINTHVWFVKLYIDSRSTTVADATNFIVQTEENTESSDAVTAATNASPKSTSDAVAVALDATGTPKPTNNIAGVPLDPHDEAKQYKICPDTLIFTGCVARDVNKRKAEAKAAYRFIAAAFPDVLPIIHSERPDLSNLASVKAEANALRGNLSVALAAQARQRREKMREQQQLSALKSEAKRLGLSPRDVGLQNTVKSLAASEAAAAALGGRLDVGQLSISSAGVSKRAGTSSAPRRKSQRSAEAETAATMTDAIRRFRRGSRFESVESDMKRDGAALAAAAASEDESSASAFAVSDAAEAETTAASSSSSSSADNPLRHLLRTALRDERDMALRVHEQRLGSGYCVYLYGIPMRDDGTLDLSGEVELASEVESSGHRALAMACYRVMQERFPERLVEAVAEDERLLDLVIG